MRIYRAADYDIESVLARTPVLSAGRRKKRARNYYDLVCTFDIETSRIKVDGEYQSFMYIWQMAIEQDVIIGRTWEDFRALIDKISAYMSDVYLIVFIHNAAYEFSFLKGEFEFSAESVFSVDKRKPLKFDIKNVEFRCSYLHSGLALKAWLNELKAPHRKQSGKDFNYNIVRYPWTPLSYRELKYCAYDVLGVVDAIHIEMERDGDNLQSLPLTKTGYVRRRVREALQDNIAYNQMRMIQPDFELYLTLKDAFRGGDTHASRFVAGKILSNIHHVDRSSSYPDVMINCMFPMSRFQKVDNPDMEDVKAAMNHDKAVLMQLSISHLRLRRYWRTGCPYISKDKCSVCINPAMDNGRVLSADVVVFSCTDVDLRIILRQYDGEIEVLKMWSSRYGYLPQSVRDVINDLYHKKTELKNVAGRELIYMLSKSMINSCYGMAAQDPAKPSILFNHSDERQFYYDTDEQRKAILEKSNHKNFLPYQIGVWVTAWARYELHEGIRLIDECPYNSDGIYNAEFCYCDTDSIFYSGDIDWSGYNKIRMDRSKKNGAFATDRKGKPHYMGVMEPEDDAKLFATMGAKKYVILDDCGTLHITIAGVAKKEGATELQKQGGIQKFIDRDNPPVFNEAGGAAIIYNDNCDINLNIDGHTLNIKDNAVIVPSCYTMGLSDDYERLLKLIETNSELLAFMGEV